MRVREATITCRSGESVMDGLKRVAKVQTAYGGGFVDSIEGLASGFTHTGKARTDWFFYVDGLIGQRGAAEIELRGGDDVWWDYRSWDFAVSVPAVVGQYPHPFAEGGRVKPIDTVVAASQAASAAAETVRVALEEAGATGLVRVGLAGGMPRPRGAHLVAVGTFSELIAVPWIGDAFEDPARSGLFARAGRLEGSSPPKVELLDAAGTATGLPPGTGVVLATAGDAPDTAVWLIGGEDTDAVARAALLLTERPSELARRVQAMVDRAGRVISLPLVSGRAG